MPLRRVRCSNPRSLSFKDKSGVGVIVDCSRDYTVMNGV